MKERFYINNHAFCLKINQKMQLKDFRKIVPARRPDEDSTNRTTKRDNKAGQLCVSSS